MDIQLPEKKKKVVEEYVTALKKKGENVRKVIVYGSTVRGDFEEASDIDLLIVGSISLDKAIELSYPLLLKYGELILPHTMSEEHYNLLKFNKSGFIYNIEKEGKLIA